MQTITLFILCVWILNVEFSIVQGEIPGKWDSRIKFPHCFDKKGTFPHISGACDLSWAFSASTTFSRRTCALRSNDINLRGKFRSYQHLLSCTRSPAWQNNNSPFLIGSAIFRELQRISQNISSPEDDIDTSSKVIDSLNIASDELQKKTNAQFKWSVREEPDRNGQYIEMENFHLEKQPSSIDTNFDCSFSASLSQAWKFIAEYGIVDEECLPSAETISSHSICSPFSTCSDSRFPRLPQKSCPDDTHFALTDDRFELLIKSVFSMDFQTCVPVLKNTPT